MRDLGYTFEECAKHEKGKIYLDGFEDGVRKLVMRGPCSLTAYLGIPENHPLANRDYSDIPLDVHGGLTFSDFGDDKTGREEGFYWYGWDYAHLWDTAFYHYYAFFDPRNKKWTPKEVAKEVELALFDFKKLMKLVEG